MQSPDEFAVGLCSHFETKQIHEALNVPGRRKLRGPSKQHDESATIVKMSFCQHWTQLLVEVVHDKEQARGHIQLDDFFTPLSSNDSESGDHTWNATLRTYLNQHGVDLHEQDIAEIWSTGMLSWVGDLLCSHPRETLEGGVDLFEDETRIFALAIDSEGISTLRWRARTATTELTATA